MRKGFKSAVISLIGLSMLGITYSQSKNNSQIIAAKEQPNRIGLQENLIEVALSHEILPEYVSKEDVQSKGAPLQQEMTLPYNQLFITPVRQNYEPETMQLKIPVLEMDAPIYGDTRPQSLKMGPCLYEYAQLPSEEGANVSIASHRIKKRGGFLEIDQLQKGDLLYLIYEESIYKYQYTKTCLVEENDWRVIYRQLAPVLTLTSCEPAFNPTYRIVVTARLVEVLPYHEDYEYLATQKQGEILKTG